MQNDTIAAIATPPGIGGIGIIRVSGADAFDVVLPLLRRPGVGTGVPPSHVLTYGHIVNPQTQEILDEVLVAFMHAPRTYTREDVVEISGHGGPLVLQRMLRLVLAQGARMANPGEFTLRAFLNGRLDLAQAEAVMDLISSQTEAGQRLAMHQLRGRVSEQVQDARHALLGVIARIEASIDFPEEDVPTPQPEELRPLIEIAQQKVDTLLAGAEQGRLYREGLRAAIIGRPNVGKSSLLNALLRTERAIVTPIAGTTRDTVEEFANVRGVPVHLIDTAGINESSDPVEQLCVQRSRAAAASADLALLVLDSSERLTAQDRAVSEALRGFGFGRQNPAASESDRSNGWAGSSGAHTGRPVILVLNKSDLPEQLTAAAVDDFWPGAPVVRTSMRTLDGLEALEEQIRALALAGQATPAADAALVTNTRHRDALRRTAAHLHDAGKTLDQGLPLDFVAIDLHGAAHALGEITGETATEDLLERIFHDFCLGK